ncbi:MAG: MlaD family protein [Methylococcales bacterium]
MTEEHQTFDLDRIDNPIESRAKGISLIWLLPIVAAIIGGWLLYNNVTERGIFIRITFDDAAGIREHQTKIIYKGIVVGEVKKLNVSEDMKSAEVTAEMISSMKAGLTEEAKFWLIKPTVSLTGISGLETLVFGNYIVVRPGKTGKSERRFKAITKAPEFDQSMPGLYLRLKASTLGSIRQGSPILFRQVPVGSIVNVALSREGEEVLIDAHIEREYADLVKNNSRFWNVSGLKIEGGLEGVKIKSESLTALIAGGIAFSSPSSGKDEDLLVSGKVFTLHQDFEHAEIGIPIAIRFNESTGFVRQGTELKYNGLTLGRVQRLELSSSGGSVLAHLRIDPDMENLLREGSKFWLVKPIFSVSGISGLDTLLKGSHIELMPGQGEPSRKFIAMDIPPSVTQGQSGLRLALLAKDVGSLNRGSLILYRKLEVGAVEDLELTADGKRIIVKVLVKEKYVHLVNKKSRFWNDSGINITAGLTEFEINTGSVASIIAGGISFFTPESKNGENLPPVREGDQFSLHEDYGEAMEQGRILLSEKKSGLHLKVTTTVLGSIRKGSPVLFKKLPVGEVKGVGLAKDNVHIDLYIHVKNEFAHLVKKTSRFWNVSGLRIDAGLSGIKIQSESLNSILSGGIAFMTPGIEADQPATDGDIFQLYDDYDSAVKEVTPVKIRFTSGDGLSTDSVIKYEGVVVGKINHVELDHPAPGVLVSASLFGSSKLFARKGTQFWVVGPKLSLTGVEKLGTLMTGKYIEMRPGTGSPAVMFKGLDAPPVIREGRSGINITLSTNHLGSLKLGSPVYYRRVTVGKVIGHELSSTRQRVFIYINIRKDYADLVCDGSKFWNVSGLSADFGLISGMKIDIESVEALLGGGIAFSTPPGRKNLENSLGRRVYNLHSKPNEIWLAWLEGEV